MRLLLEELVLVHHVQPPAKNVLALHLTVRVAIQTSASAIILVRHVFIIKYLQAINQSAYLAFVPQAVRLVMAALAYLVFLDMLITLNCFLARNVSMIVWLAHLPILVSVYLALKQPTYLMILVDPAVHSALLASITVQIAPVASLLSIYMTL